MSIERPAVCAVPAGTYPIGSKDNLLARPPHTATLRAFALMQTTVTNAMFAAFITAGGYDHGDLWTDAGWRWKTKEREPGFWRDERYNQPDQPVVGVCWYEALAYARWFAKTTQTPWRLPSEAEWEAAARGEHDEAPRPRQYNTVERKLGAAWPVTTPGNVSWCGAHDLCGNVWEWCNTRWGRQWQNEQYPYPYSAGDGRELVDEAYARILRGGSWFDPLPQADPVNRARYLPGSRASNIGFRLAHHT